MNRITQIHVDSLRDKTFATVHRPGRDSAQYKVTPSTAWRLQSICDKCSDKDIIIAPDSVGIVMRFRKA